MKYRKALISMLAITIVIVLSLSPFIWNRMKCQYNAPYIESTTGIPLCSKKDNNCRIVNLNELIEDSNGTGKIYFLRLFNKETSVYHLAICNQNNLIVDKKNLIINNVKCSKDNIELNTTNLPKGSNVLLEILAISNVKKNKVVNTRYEKILSSDFLHTLQALRYTTIYLEQKQLND